MVVRFPKKGCGTRKMIRKAQLSPRSEHQQRFVGSGGSSLSLFQRLLKGVPGERGALDAHRELHDALERFEVPQADALEVGGEVGAITFTLELRLVDGHQRL